MDFDDKQKLFKMLGVNEPDEKMLLSKLFSQVYLCEKNCREYFSDFYDPYRANRYAGILTKMAEINVFLFGGIEGAERLMIGTVPKPYSIKPEDFPIDVLKFSYNPKFSKLSHRDFLGALMSLHIDRSKIGDIAVNEGFAFVFVTNEMSEYILNNIDTVRNSSVKAEILDTTNAAITLEDSQASEVKITVPSLRIDTVISHIFKLSRTKSADLISAEKIFVNWMPEKSVSRNLIPGDTITLRGKGRAEFVEIIGKSKKGSLVIKLRLRT